MRYPRIEQGMLRDLLSQSDTVKVERILSAYGVKGGSNAIGWSDAATEDARALIDAALQDSSVEREEKVADFILHGIPLVERRAAVMLRRLGVAPIDLEALAIANKTVMVWTGENTGLSAHVSDAFPGERRLVTNIDLAETVNIVTQGDDVTMHIRKEFPETLLGTMRGMALSGIVAHPLLDDDIRILSAVSRSGRTTLFLDIATDWIDPLSLRPEHAR